MGNNIMHIINRIAQDCDDGGVSVKEAVKLMEEEIDAYEPYEYTYIWRDANDSNWSSPGKTLTVTADEVSFSRTYICDVSKGGI